MKKKRILFGCLVATMSLVISACDFLPQDLFNNFLNNNNSSEQTTSARILPSRPSSSSAHTHTFSEAWSYNNTAHWHDSTCGHNVRSEAAEHTFESIILKDPTCTTSGEQIDVCTICDYQRTISLPPVDHNWQEYSQVPPDCYNSGISRRYCTMCGTTIEEYLPPLGHDYQPISYIAPTCSSTGYTTQQCTRCGDIIEYAIPTTEHTWGKTYSVGGYDGDVSYTKNTCTKCGAIRIMIKALDGNFDGAYKSGAALDYGYMKLQSNGNSVSYSFNYPNAAIGTVYQHAVFDMNPGSFESYTYQSGNSATGFNFEMAINNQLVDLSTSAYISYGEFLNSGEEIEGLTYNGYSHAANCLIGSINLLPGTNTMTYTRRASYNLWVDYFVFVLYNSNHTHTASSNWDYDDSYHWHYCTNPNCPIPNTRIDSAPHTYGDLVTLYEPTCHSEGLQREICTICGYQHDIALPTTEHNYQPLGAFEKVNDCVYVEEYSCSNCNQYALRWNALDYDQSLSNGIDIYNNNAVRFTSSMVENEYGEEKLGAHLVYKFNSPRAVNNAGLSFLMSQSTGQSPFVNANGTQGYIRNEYGELVPSDKKYGLRVNGVEIYLGEDTYGTVKNSSSAWYDWPVSFNLVAGENTIDIYCLSSSYRGRMYEFQITGLPYFEPNHAHAPADYLEYDADFHYYPCTNNDGTRFNEEAHTYGEYILVSDPTCTEYGQEKRVCSVCGYEQYTSLSPYGHQWDDGVVVTASTHTTDGQKMYTCQVCGEQKYEVIKAGHNWSEPTVVEPSDDYVGYIKTQCMDDDAVQIDIKAMDGVFSGGYSTMGNGYIRLGGTGQSVSYKFKYGDHAVGKLYLRGSVNNYSSYRTRPVLNSASVGSNGYTFEVSVNNSLVDMSELNNFTFGDVFENGYVDSSLSTSYSPVADCPIGTVEIVPGENTITYQRNGGYNIYMSDIILVLEPTDHVHTASRDYAYDDNYHWHYCLDPNCPNPNTAIDKEEHTFVPVESGEQIGCYSENSIVYVCTKCGYQKGYNGYTDHTFNEAYYTANSDGYEVRVSTCSTCGRTVTSMNFDQGIVTNGSYNGKLQAGTTMTWKIPVTKTGWVSIYLPCKMSAGNTGQTYDPSLYNISVNGNNLSILMPYGTYDELGINSTDTKYYKWAEYYVSQNDVINGEIEISFTSNVSSYRMTFDGEIRIEF